MDSFVFHAVLVVGRASLPIPAHDDDKTDAFGPFLSALMKDPTPTGRANDVISTITFGGSEALQTACKALCTEFIVIFQDEVAREPARIPPFF